MANETPNRRTAGDTQTVVGPRPVVSPRLRKLLLSVLALFALLVVNSAYLGAVTWRQWFTGAQLEDAAYHAMFLAHLGLGLAITVPAIVYGVMHLRRAIGRPNRLAVRLGLALFGCVLVVLASGFALTRGIPVVELRDPAARTVAYWAHVAAPLAVCWLFVLHRLAGRPIRWAAGGAIATLALAIGAASLFIAERGGPSGDGEVTYPPSFARTSGGDILEHLVRDDDCAGCHADAHAGWQYSAHRFASFNNPAYAFSVRNTRDNVLARDGDLRAARVCAGCHDLAPLFSGRFDDPDFDDRNDPTATLGIGCVGCHAIAAVGVRGNADYTLAVPERYPFAMSENGLLRALNGFLIKAKPDLHKRTFLKPLHKTAAFCGTCHKVQLPESLNGYRWLRGQNHYDSFLLSGVSGHGVASFYYPARAEANCNGCHMPLLASTDFAARRNDASGQLTVHNHGFAAANTALVHLLGLPDHVLAEHRRMLEGALRVDIFAVHAGTDITAPTVALVRPGVPALAPDREYVFDIVLRNLRVGHLFTEGTADSNEVWLEVTATSGGRLIGASGHLAPDGAVDPWSHFVNAYVLDKDGNRIDRRNAEDIFTPLYNHQILPGGATTVHYRLRLPADAQAPVTLRARLLYRKFDTTYLRHFLGDELAHNDLPIIAIAEDTVRFAVRDAGASSSNQAAADAPDVRNAPDARKAPDVPGWQRWNDYGIGLLAKPQRGALRQAEDAFRKVARLGRPEGDLNLARVLLREGRLAEAGEALRRAEAAGAVPWSLAWFGAQVARQSGDLDTAIENMSRLVQTRFPDARRRGFDFSQDYRLLNTLGATLFDRAKLAPAGEEHLWLTRANQRYHQTLAQDPENVAAHYGLAQVYARRGDVKAEARHRQLHQRYRKDDNAADRAVALARRRDAAANHAAEAVVVYDLRRQGAYGLTR